MAKRRVVRRDPLDGSIESALHPGRYIGWNEGFPFVSNLRHLEGDIAKVVNTDPARATRLARSATRQPGSCWDGWTTTMVSARIWRLRR